MVNGVSSVAYHGWVDWTGSWGCRQRTVPDFDLVGDHLVAVNHVHGPVADRLDVALRRRARSGPHLFAGRGVHDGDDGALLPGEHHHTVVARHTTVGRFVGAP